MGVTLTTAPGSPVAGNQGSLFAGPAAAALLQDAPARQGIAYSGPERRLGRSFPQPPQPQAAPAPLSRKEDLATQLPELLPRLWRFALRLTANRHDAEDLLQRSCVRALERQHQLEPETSPLSWMYSIVHSVWLNEVRARQIRNQASMQWSEDLAATVSGSSAIDPETDALHQQVIAAVGRLPDAQRAVMLLVGVEGLSYKEAADALGIPIGTVMSRLARARLSIGEAFANQNADLRRVG
jgi:RNA polymerase sigma-70 factor, ECF subfamily